MSSCKSVVFKTWKALPLSVAEAKVSWLAPRYIIWVSLKAKRNCKDNVDNIAASGIDLLRMCLSFDFQKWNRLLDNNLMVILLSLCCNYTIEAKSFWWRAAEIGQPKLVFGEGGRRGGTSPFAWMQKSPSCDHAVKVDAKQGQNRDKEDKRSLHEQVYRLYHKCEHKNDIATKKAITIKTERTKRKRMKDDCA